MNDQAIRFRIGIFVLASLILLAVLVTLFGGFPDFFKTRSTYTIVLDEGRGLNSGTPVFKSGVKIGHVTSVGLTDDGKVEVGIAVDPKYALRKGDVPMLEKSLLGNDSIIQFKTNPAAPDASFVESGSRIQGQVHTDPNQLLERTGQLVNTANEALKEMSVAVGQINKVMERLDTKSFKRLEQLVAKMEGTLDEVREGVKSAREGFPDIKKTLDEIQELSKSAKAVLPDAKRTMQEFQVAAQNWGKVGERTDVLLQTYEPKLAKSLDSLQNSLESVSKLLNEENRGNVVEILRNTKKGSERLDNLTKQAEDTMRNLDKTLKPLADKGPQIVKNLEEGTEKLNRVLGDARELIQAIGRAEGTFSKILTDPSLYNNLNDGAAAFVRILPRVDRMMRDLETFADRIARHPEALGVGGAIRPSSGIK
jgi:phospholipid/cholesterol/gamma-HCH transport system substrate-binding protein